MIATDERLSARIIQTLVASSLLRIGTGVKPKCSIIVCGDREPLERGSNPLSKPDSHRKTDYCKAVTIENQTPKNRPGAIIAETCFAPTMRRPSQRQSEFLGILPGLGSLKAIGLTANDRKPGFKKILPDCDISSRWPDEKR